MVIYGLITQTNIAKLFAAGLLPGIVAILCYMAAVQFMVRWRPALGPPTDRATWRQRFLALRGIWGVIVLFVVVIGGIYVGIFTPTEAAGIGAFGAFIFLLFRRALTPRKFFEVLAETAVTTSMLFAVLIGALIFANFVNDAGMPGELAAWINSLHVAPLTVILVVALIYIALGCVFESVSMMLLTVPVFVPVISTLDFGLGQEQTLIWFCIIVVVVTEIGLITPPVGMNVFVLRGVIGDVPTSRIFAGVTPFLIADFVRLTILIFVPQLSLFLPSLL